MISRWRSWLPRAGLYAAAVLLSAWVLVPIYFITLAAFSTQQEVYHYPDYLFPHSLSTSTLRYFLTSYQVVPSLERSIEVAALTLVLGLGVGTPAGYALARFAFRGANAFRLALVSTRAFPFVILAVPLAVTFLNWGIDDTVYGVALAHAALGLPFVVLVTASVFTAISAELEEAAMTLGCTRPAAFFRIVLPLARPGLAAAAIFTFIISWNEVFVASILTLTHRTLPALVLNELDQSPVPYQFAAGFVMLAPSLLVMFASRKYLFSSIRAVGG
jgi:multiple sugar transport system permease protein